MAAIITVTDGVTPAAAAHVNQYATLLSNALGLTDTVQTELGRLQLPSLSAAPSSPSEGQVYYDTNNKVTYTYNGSVWVPQQAPSGSVLDGVANYKHIVKAADETVISSTSVQNDNELFLPLLANEVWFAEFFIIVLSASAVEEIKFTFTVPALATGGFTYSGAQETNSASGVNLAFAATHSVAILANLSRILPIQVHVINGANAGNLQFQWAQHASGATGMTVKAGSFLRALKIG